MVQVLAMSIVCESIPQQRDRLEFISVVARYTSSNSPSVEEVGQFEFQCTSGTWNMNVYNSPSFRIPSDTTFDTPVRRDCGVCIHPDSVVVSLAGRPYDNITHCVGK